MNSLFISRRFFVSLMALTTVVIPSQPADATPPPNDNCSTPAPLFGSGVFSFDLTMATFSGEGQDAMNCAGPAGTGFDHDVWYCWTAPCTGLVDITTCGLTAVDTKIAFYANGCACPTPPPSIPPLCCNDDRTGTPCGVQSSINCEVVCGQQYLIRLGVKLGTLPGTGSFQISCNGTPCECDDCCGGRPQFLTTAGFLGGVAAVTQEMGVGTRGLTFVDISGQPAPSSGQNWIAAPHYIPSGAQVWTKANLGTIYGVAFDAAGNTFVAHTAVYSVAGDTIGSIAGGAAGAIFRIDTNTGVPSTFVVLPNSMITACVGTECWPGLGDLAYSCFHRTLYASNFEDGRIYAINGVGTVTFTWKHSTGISGVGGLPDPMDTNGFSPLGPHAVSGRGQRVWGLAVSKGRLYYGVWREDMGRPSATDSNEVWSVGLVPGGANIGQPIAGTEQLEVTMPVISGTFSNPVAGISFRPNTCCMLLAERSMQNDTLSGAHSSRLRELCQNGPAWFPSGVSFATGDASAGIPQSTAGGCDYDFHTGSGVNVNVWATSDALKLSSIPPPFEAIYGIGGIPFAGSNPKVDGHMIDSNQSTAAGDKFQQGDVQITCPQQIPPPCQPDEQGMSCINACPPPGLPCVPLEITLGLDGVYRITKCGCTDFCHVEMGPGGPICVWNCPVPQQGLMCMLIAKGNLDGSITFKCDCVDATAPQCGMASECDPDHPGQCKPACVGKCPPGFACIPTEIYENPAGSGNYQISKCDCLPIVNPPCHPVVINGILQCLGICPTTGGKCKITAIPDPPPPPPLVGGVHYVCNCKCVHPPANMTDWWPMDDNPPVAPINDIAGILNNGTPSGGVSSLAAPPSCVARGLFFNGTGVVTVPNVPGPADINFGTGNFTLEGWVQCDFPALSYNPLLDKRTQTGSNINGYAMFMLGGQLGFQLAGNSFGNFVTTGLNNLQDAQCHHVAAVVTRGATNNIRLFVDGVAQNFTNTSITGSVTNTAALIFGQDYPIIGSVDSYSGILDEWEFFRRALTNAEIQALYNARSLGKCRETCYLPQVTFCMNHTNRNFCFQICNYTSTAYTYNWNLSGPIGGPGCNNVGSITFTPSAGSTTVLPGQCKTICVNMTRPTGLPLPPPFLMGCYQLSVINNTTGNAFGCTNKILASKQWCFECVPIWAIAKVRVGTTRTFAPTLTNTMSPVDVLDYAWNVYNAETGERDTQVVRLNGLPPGTPVIGTLALPMGNSTPLPIDVSVDEHEPFGVLEIVLEHDSDGDGVPDPVDRLAINTIHPCAGETPAGDVNEDGATDFFDIDPFVQALLGAPVKPYVLVLADINCDGLPNGMDIQPFVNSVRTGP